MMAKINFEEWVDVQGPIHGPEKPFQCVNGIESHNWQLQIQEGQLALITDCGLCKDGIASLEPEDLAGEFNDVRIKFFQEGGGDQTYWYWCLFSARDEQL